MAKETKDVSIEEKLRALYTLQQIDSKIDKIRTIRGELPLEVQDLEDEIEGLDTRIAKLNEELKTMETAIADKKNQIKESLALIKKYEGQQMNVRNNREFDALSKEIEFQQLEIQLAEKRIKENTVAIAQKTEVIQVSVSEVDERRKDLDHKKGELNEIVEETQKEEEMLAKKSQEAAAKIEDRLYTAYKRIRSNARNGLSVVSVERDACGGCFNKIPPQRQLDVKTHKKVIVCEHCGRILVDQEILLEGQLV